MDKNKFYILTDKDSKDCYCALFQNNRINDVSLFKGIENKTDDAPYILRYNYGKKLNDIVATGYPGLYLFSDKIINILITNKVTGWKTYPCLFLDKNNKEIYGYSVFSVVGRCDCINLLESDVFERAMVKNGRPAKMLSGLSFDINTWDGNDIFSPKGTMFTIVTQKVRDVLIKEGLSNILLKDITEYEQISFNNEFRDVSDENILKLFGL